MPDARLPNKFISENKIFKSRVDYPDNLFFATSTLRIHLIRGVMPRNFDNTLIIASRSRQHIFIAARANYQAGVRDCGISISRHCPCSSR
ncbi:hypothetical protein CNECB9_4400004 [Cupriavidus necator]|uniref:Uncharacterized protein n=1 Tax=Cupriavidus necator TaxID=106590 RepID=A0A1K0IYE2_CUPNE|nr:hypothetical protein CNECB9_4400004 [Cupriavidus necator]